MNRLNSNKIIYYSLVILISFAVLVVFIYPWLNNMTKEDVSTKALDTSVDKAFFQKIEALQDNTIEFEEENTPTENPFNEV